MKKKIVGPVYRIRLAREEEAKAIDRAIHYGLPEKLGLVPQYDENLRKSIRHERVLVAEWIKEDGGRELAGAIHWYDEGATFKVANLFVFPLHRRKKVGTRLLLAAMAAAEAKGKECCTLRCREDLTAANAFWAAMKYQRTTRREKPNNRGVYTWEFERPIRIEPEGGGL